MLIASHVLLAVRYVLAVKQVRKRSLLVSHCSKNNPNLCYFQTGADKVLIDGGDHENVSSYKSTAQHRGN